MQDQAKKKRVLIVCQHFWPENFRINDIADFFANEKNCDVEVLCGLPNYPSGKLFEGYSFFKNRRQIHNSIKISRVLEVPRGNNSNLRIFLNYVSFPFFSLFHIPRLLNKDYDHILIYQLSPVMMALPGIIVGKMTRTPTTIYVMDMWPENLLSVIKITNPLLLSLLTRHSHWYYKKSTRLIGMSRAMTRHIQELTGKPDSQMATIPQSCEKLHEKTIIDTALTAKYDATFNVLFTGNISPAQSFPTMIKAARILKKKGYDKIRWVIVGDGMSRKETEKEVMRNGLEKVFIFEGQKPIEDIPKFTHIAHVLVGCLVKSELLEATIPAKVVSYFASGKPIVVAMDGEVQDLINKQARCGFAGPTEDAKVLASNIEKVYKMSPQEQQALGKRGRTYHFAHFERSIVLNKLYRFMFPN